MNSSAPIWIGLCLLLVGPSEATAQPAADDSAPKTDVAPAPAHPESPPPADEAPSAPEPDAAAGGDATGDAGTPAEGSAAPAPTSEETEAPAPSANPEAPVPDESAGEPTDEISPPAEPATPPIEAAPTPTADAEVHAAAPAVMSVQTSVQTSGDAGAPGAAGGLKGGLNFGRWLGHGPAKGVNLGLCLGGYYRRPIGRQWSVQFEFLMTDKGSDLKTLTGENTEEALLYVELPVLARTDFPLSQRLGLYGVGGVAPAYLIDSKQGAESDRRRLDVSLTAGFGAEMTVGKHDIAAELRLSQGLLNVIDDDSTPAARNSIVSLYTAISL